MGVLESLQLHGDGIDVPDEQGVVGVGGVSHGGRDIEVTALSVESGVPGLFLGVVDTSRRVPMPAECDDTTTLGESNGVFDCCGV